MTGKAKRENQRERMRHFLSNVGTYAASRVIRRALDFQIKPILNGRFHVALGLYQRIEHRGNLLACGTQVSVSYP